MGKKKPLRDALGHFMSPRKPVGDGSSSDEDETDEADGTGAGGSEACVGEGDGGRVVQRREKEKEERREERRLADARMAQLAQTLTERREPSGDRGGGAQLSNVPPFTGDDKGMADHDFKDWLVDFEEEISYSNPTDGRRLGWLKGKLQGAARGFYKSLPQETRQDYDALTLALDTHFRDHASTTVRYKAAFECKMSESETVNDFDSRLVGALRRAAEAAPIDQETLHKHLLLVNLTQDLQSKVFSKVDDEMSAEQLRVYANTLQQAKADYHRVNDHKQLSTRQQGSSADDSMDDALPRWGRRSRREMVHRGLQGESGAGSRQQGGRREERGETGAASRQQVGRREGEASERVERCETGEREERCEAGEREGRCREGGEREGVARREGRDRADEACREEERRSAVERRDEERREGSDDGVLHPLPPVVKDRKRHVQQWRAQPPRGPVDMAAMMQMLLQRQAQAAEEHREERREERRREEERRAREDADAEERRRLADEQRRAEHKRVMQQFADRAKQRHKAEEQRREVAERRRKVDGPRLKAVELQLKADGRLPEDGQFPDGEPLVLDFTGEDEGFTTWLHDYEERANELNFPVIRRLGTLKGHLRGRARLTYKYIDQETRSDYAKLIDKLSQSFPSWIDPNDKQAVEAADFKGDNNDFRDWLEEYEEGARAFNYTNEYKLKNLKWKLKGQARRYYKMLSAETRQDYGALTFALGMHFHDEVFVERPSEHPPTLPPPARQPYAPDQATLSKQMQAMVTRDVRQWFAGEQHRLSQTIPGAANGTKGANKKNKRKKGKGNKSKIENLKDTGINYKDKDEPREKTKLDMILLFKILLKSIRALIIKTEKKDTNTRELKTGDIEMKWTDGDRYKQAYVGTRSRFPIVLRPTEPFSFDQPDPVLKDTTSINNDKDGDPDTMSNDDETEPTTSPTAQRHDKGGRM